MKIEDKIRKEKTIKKVSSEDKEVINMLSTYPQFSKKRKL